MIAACKSAANLEFVIDDTANKVLQKLEPKLGGLSNVMVFKKSLLRWKTLEWMIVWPGCRENWKLQPVPRKFSVPDWQLMLLASIYRLAYTPWQLLLLLYHWLYLRCWWCIHCLRLYKQKCVRCYGLQINVVTAKSSWGCGYEVVLDPSEYGENGGVLGAAVR